MHIGYLKPREHGNQRSGVAQETNRVEEQPQRGATPPHLMHVQGDGAAVARRLSDPGDRVRWASWAVRKTGDYWSNVGVQSCLTTPSLNRAQGATRKAGALNSVLLPAIVAVGVALPVAPAG